MYFLNANVLRQSTAAVAEAFDFRHESTRRDDFLKCVRRIQAVPAQLSSGGIHYEWQNDDMVQFLRSHDVMSDSEIHEDRHIVPENDRDAVFDFVKRAFLYIAETRDDFSDMIHELIGTMAFFRLDEQDGGSVSSAIGYIYLSPKSHWSTAYCAEMIVHEFVHNSLFLIDMVEGLFPNLENLHLPQAAVTSVLRGQKRPYDKAFHSACVATALIQFHSRAGNHKRAADLFAPLATTVQELFEVDELCVREGIEIITDRIRLINKELDTFCKTHSTQHVLN